MQYLSTKSQTAAPRKLKTEAQKNCGHKPTLTLSLSSPPPFHNIRSLCTRARIANTHTFKLKWIQCRTVPVFVGPSRENRAWYKLEHICFCCIKAKSDIALITPWQNGISQTSSQSNASYNDDIFCQATTRGPVLIVELCFETLLQLPVCPFMKEEGAARRSSENTVTDFRIPTTYR